MKHGLPLRTPGRVSISDVRSIAGGCYCRGGLRQPRAWCLGTPCELGSCGGRSGRKLTTRSLARPSVRAPWRRPARSARSAMRSVTVRTDSGKRVGVDLHEHVRAVTQQVGGGAELADVRGVAHHVGRGRVAKAVRGEPWHSRLRGPAARGSGRSCPATPGSRAGSPPPDRGRTTPARRPDAPRPGTGDGRPVPWPWPGRSGWCGVSGRSCRRSTRAVRRTSTRACSMRTVPLLTSTAGQRRPSSSLRRSPYSAASRRGASQRCPLIASRKRRSCSSVQASTSRWRLGLAT